MSAARVRITFHSYALLDEDDMRF